MKTAAFNKLRALNPEIMSLHAELANEADPELDEAMDRAMKGAIDDFVANQDATATTD